MVKTYCIGDIHGRYSALRQLLTETPFNIDKDRLITLGDICDGGRKTRQCYDLLLTVPNRVDVVGNHDCLTPDAEALTKRGWLKYTDLTTFDEVYSFDTARGVGTWMPINEVVIKYHDGETVVVDTNRCKMNVTPTHRVLCKQRTSHGWGDYNYIYANNLTHRIKIISTADTALPEYDISDDKIRLTAWILTDGHITSRGYIQIFQSKEDNVQEISTLLDNLEYDYAHDIRNRSIPAVCGKPLVKSSLPQHAFRIHVGSSREIHEYISEKIKIPQWVYELSPRQFDIFLHTLIVGDGSFYRSGKTTAVLYGEEEFLKNVQGVCATKGFTATMVFDTRGCSRLNICDSETIEFDCYASISNGYYSGDVWCINTPLSNFMVRQGGTHFFTGNCWFYDWIVDGTELPLWTHQGGLATMESYGFDRKNVPSAHKEFIKNSLRYFIDEKNNIYVHGGFNPKVPIEKQKLPTIVWDRTLIKYAREHVIKQYNRVFVGHTTTQAIDKTVSHPITFNNLTMCDCGAGWMGRLALVDVDTFDYWVSDIQVPRYEPGDEELIDTEEEAWGYV